MMLAAANAVTGSGHILTLRRGSQLKRLRGLAPPNVFAFIHRASLCRASRAGPHNPRRDGFSGRTHLFRRSGRSKCRATVPEAPESFNVELRSPTATG
jgi:hypothetical protein